MSLADLLEAVSNMEMLEVLDAYTDKEIYNGIANDCPWRIAVFSTVKAVEPFRPQDVDCGLRIKVSLSR